MGAEKIELNSIVDGDQVVSRHADQAEGPRMVELIEEIDADRVEPLRNVGRFAESALARQDLKVRGLERYPRRRPRSAFA